MQFEDCFEIGYILKPHGLNGAVTIQMDADDPMKYKGMESVIVKIGNNLVPFFISSLQINEGKGILHLEDVNTKEDAEELKSCSLLLPLDLLPKLDENQFYYHEVIGYKIVDHTKGGLGNIENIISGGKQDLIAMKYKDQEILIPVTDQIVIRADHEKKEVYVSLPEGLLDIYLQD
jgi:16S rRNA processing protein RimM